MGENGRITSIEKFYHSNNAIIIEKAYMLSLKEKYEQREYH